MARVKGADKATQIVDSMVTGDKQKVDHLVQQAEAVSWQLLVTELGPIAEAVNLAVRKWQPLSKTNIT